jgi:hypothetical protein
VFNHLRITHTDGTVADVSGRRADMVRFERHFKVPAGRMFDGEGMFVEHLWFYGYAAESRDSDVGEFDAWVETVDSVEIITDADDEATESPTDPSPSPSA